MTWAELFFYTAVCRMRARCVYGGICRDCRVHRAVERVFNDNHFTVRRQFDMSLVQFRDWYRSTAVTR